MFLEISQVSQESTCVGVSLKTCSFTEHLQWLLLWFLQQNNLIFNVITIILGHILNKNCHGNTLIIITPPPPPPPMFYIKISHLPSKVCPSGQNILLPFPPSLPKSKLLDPLKHLFLYNFSIFEGEWWCIP